VTEGPVAGFKSGTTLTVSELLQWVPSEAERTKAPEVSVGRDPLAKLPKVEDQGQAGGKPADILS
jgi:hypothetical protein